MCKNGEIPGVIKQGRSWMIPANKENSIQNECPAKKQRPLPIGISDFKLATLEYYYVDKTLLIRDFLDNKPMVSLFTRPRRFGKTLNMDMLRVFFEKTEEDTSVYFQNKLIMYYILHEADISKFTDIVDALMKVYFHETNLNRIRTVYGCTQTKL